jgi:hypothetical protein
MMGRMPLAGEQASARALITSALEIYDMLAASAWYMADLDSGVAVQAEAGRRWIRARGEAADWILDDEAADRVGALFEAATLVDDDEVVEWLERFPRAFLALLDRRQSGVPRPDTPGRRFVDRVAAAPQPRA